MSILTRRVRLCESTLATAYKYVFAKVSVLKLSEKQWEIDWKSY